LRFAVTGAGGRLGGQVVELLAAEEAHQVVALSRREMPSERPLTHVSTVAADYTDPEALRVAMRGVDTLVFVSSDGEAAKVILHHQNVIRAATASGVAHIVALSGLDADLESPFCYAVTNGHTEQVLNDSGCSVSIARASIFTEFFMRWLTQARTSGQIRVPAADGRVSLVSRTDVGRCLATLALAAPTGRHHDITGPESLDLATIAAQTEHEWEIPIEYVDLTPAAHRAEMARAGESAWWLYAFSTMFDSVREQRWASVSEEVFRLTGRPPTSLRNLLAHSALTTGRGRGRRFGDHDVEA
jgi:NAD(P)H dehydrogenase (quinone)